MDIIQTTLMGIIQGLTEFFPVSSSAHLVIVSSLYKLIGLGEIVHGGEEEIFTDIILHLGTLMAILVFFKKDISNMIKAFINGVKTKDFSSFEARMPIYLVIGTIFTILVAYPIKDFCDMLTGTPSYVGGFLMITGCVLLLSEKITANKKPANKITLKQSIIIGLAQGIAALPGMSRSAMTICAGLLTGLDRVTAARYSFLLSILIIIGASVCYPIIEFQGINISSFNWESIIVGFIVAFITGYFCIKYFLKFLSKYSMNVFAYYCLFAGFCVMMFFGNL